MTTALSTASGNADRAGASTLMTTSATIAVAMPETWLRAPADAAVAVFDSDPATPSPPKIPAAMLAVPAASSSWSALTRYPPLTANSRAALSPSASPTRAREPP